MKRQNKKLLMIDFDFTLIEYHHDDNWLANFLELFKELIGPSNYNELLKDVTEADIWCAVRQSEYFKNEAVKNHQGLVYSFTADKFFSINDFNLNQKLEETLQAESQNKSTGSSRSQSSIDTNNTNTISQNSTNPVEALYNLIMGIKRTPGQFKLIDSIYGSFFLNIFLYLSRLYTLPDAPPTKSSSSTPKAEPEVSPLKAHPPSCHLSGASLTHIERRISSLLKKLFPTNGHLSERFQKSLAHNDEMLLKITDRISSRAENNFAISNIPEIKRVFEKLRGLRRKGVSVVLLSNNFRYFIEHLLENILGPGWTDSFDVCSSYAEKPSYFRRENEADQESSEESLSNTSQYIYRDSDERSSKEGGFKVVVEDGAARLGDLVQSRETEKSKEGIRRLLEIRKREGLGDDRESGREGNEDLERTLLECNNAFRNVVLRNKCLLAEKGNYYGLLELLGLEDGKCDAYLLEDTLSSGILLPKIYKGDLKPVFIERKYFHNEFDIDVIAGKFGLGKIPKFTDVETALEAIFSSDVGETDVK